MDSDYYAGKRKFENAMKKSRFENLIFLLSLFMQYPVFRTNTRVTQDADATNDADADNEDADEDADNLNFFDWKWLEQIPEFLEFLVSLNEEFTNTHVLSHLKSVLNGIISAMMCPQIDSETRKKCQKLCWNVIYNLIEIHQKGKNDIRVTLQHNEKQITTELWALCHVFRMFVKQITSLCPIIRPVISGELRVLGRLEIDLENLQSQLDDDDDPPNDTASIIEQIKQLESEICRNIPRGRLLHERYDKLTEQMKIRKDCIEINDHLDRLISHYSSQCCRMYEPSYMIDPVMVAKEMLKELTIIVENIFEICTYTL